MAGKKLTEEVFLRLLDDEAGKLKAKSVDTAREILRWTTISKKLIPWISDPLNVVLDEESPEVIAAALKAYFDTYVTTGKRLTKVAGADSR
ncbi:MAG: hypothetical protein JJE32_04875 [Deltaproteobacteria bacterium]|nr:hypothetical protein [Deltaproteobacteria bacterium]